MKLHMTTTSKERVTMVAKTNNLCISCQTLLMKIKCAELKQSQLVTTGVFMISEVTTVALMPHLASGPSKLKKSWAAHDNPAHANAK